MAGVTLSNHDAVILDLYDKSKLREISLSADPIISLIEHEDTWNGDQWWLAIKHGTNQSVSATFATAQGLNHYNQYKKFAIDPYEYFGEVHFTRRFVKQAQGDGVAQDAYVNGVKDEFDGVLKTLQHEKAFQFYHRLGVRGRLTAASNVATKTVYLRNPYDTAFFHVGMQVQLSQDPGTGAARAGVETIEAIDIDTGALTCVSATWATVIGAAAASDYIFRSGDHAAGYQGLASWIPTTAPTLGVTFNGVDRAVDSQRLSGNRLTAGALSISEALRTMAAKIAFLGGKPNVAVLNTFKWTDLESELHTAGYRDFKDSDAEFGFEAIRLRTPGGTIKVYGSPFCDYYTGYVLDTSTWKFKSAGMMPEIFTDDNTKILQVYNANEYTGRLGWIGNLGCKAPGFNGVIDLT